MRKQVDNELVKKCVDTGQFVEQSGFLGRRELCVLIVDNAILGLTRDKGGDDRKSNEKAAFVAFLYGLEFDQLWFCFLLIPCKLDENESLAECQRDPSDHVVPRHLLAVERIPRGPE